ncbi:MAG: adenylate/guanylate cyclase domain-containing protein [Oscillatoriales cyanobacterium SM2_2_1]|nr:adenylate/guanylate cyclase domain-containing protein [Oscillatoriales cyanobacterium SM2_2_1]
MPIAAILRARLSLSIALGIFISILVIEGIIFIPSYLRRERELVALKQDLISAKLWGAAQSLASAPAEISQSLPQEQTKGSISAVDGVLWGFFAGRATQGSIQVPEGEVLPGAIPVLMRQLGTVDGIKGWRLYDQNRQLLAEEAPEQNPQFLPVRLPQGDHGDCLNVNELQITNLMPLWTAIAGWDGSYLDVICQLREGEAVRFLAIRVDGTPILQELSGFAWRIGGLVVVISLFVTGTMMVVLWPLVIQPIIRLRGDLLLAKAAVHDPSLEKEFCHDVLSRQDELGDLARSFQALYHSVVTEITARKAAETEAIAQQETSERLLLNILPAAIAERLKRGEEIIADGFAEASVLFADLVDFTGLAGRTDPAELVSTLNEIFSQFDELTSQLGLEKIKTIGDAYMVVGGLPQPRPDHPMAIAEMALGMQRVMAQYRSRSGEHFALRIGIHLGAVVAGVIGKSKFIYDLWGDAVNIASRMESQGVAERIQISEAVYLRLKESYLCQPRGRSPSRAGGRCTPIFCSVG